MNAATDSPANIIPTTVEVLSDFLITRDGLPPIKFKGTELLSVDSRNHNSTRWTVLTLYKTKGGRYVIERNWRTAWQGEKNHDEAESHENARGVIEFLRNDEGDIGSLSQELIERAGKELPDFAATWVEEVE